MSLDRLKAAVRSEEDEGPPYLNEYSDQPETPEEARERIETAYRELIEQRLEKAEPVARLVFDRVKKRVAALIERNPERHVIVAMKVFNKDWLDAVGAGTKLALRVALNDPRVPISFMSNERKPYRDSDGFRIQSLYELLSKGHVICLLAPDEKLPPQFCAIVDMTIDFHCPSPEEVAKLFGLGEMDSLSRLDFGQVAAASLNTAARRGGRAAERLAVLNALLAAAAEESESETAQNDDVPIEPKLETLEGYGGARQWGLQVAADIADYRAGRIGWSEIDQGALLVGPPGTGKTLFAKALAASAGLAFFPTSYSDWQSHKSGHLGDVTKKIRDVFESAAKAGTALVFIDEIDTLPARGDSTHNDSWFTAVTTTLLEMLDGTARREGVIVVAACNNDSNLDGALVRSGRLDRKFFVGLPDRQALIGIFRHHLGCQVDDDVLDRVATLFAGSLSGADVVRISRDARRRARNARRVMTGDDLIAVAVPEERRPAQTLRRIAVHEAGHAVAYMSFGHVPNALSLVGMQNSGGSVSVARDPAQLEGVQSDLDQEVVCMLAGRAAEDVIIGSISGGAGGVDESDLGRATRVMIAAESVLGLGGTLVHNMEADGKRVHQRLARQYGEAIMLIHRHKLAVEALARLAIKKRVLGRAALEAFATEFGFVGNPAQEATTKP